MPSHIERMRTLEAIRRSSIHQSISSPSSRMAMISRNSINADSNDPLKALDAVRSLIQKDITEKVRQVIQQYADDFFHPAVENIKKNLEENVDSEMLMERVCLDAIDHAKTPFVRCKTSSALSVIKGIIPSLTIEPAVLKRPVIQEPVQLPLVPCATPQAVPVRRTFHDLILVTKQGKPVRREGADWDPSRLTPDTIFILGSRANKALGLGQTRGRLYMKHPELFKYPGDQEDKEWLTKQQIMSTTGGKAYLMVLDDILRLSRSDEYASHPKQKPEELQAGFRIPQFMLVKMKQFMLDVQTDPGVTDEELLAEAKEQVAKMEDREAGKKGKKKVKKPLPEPMVTIPLEDLGEDEAMLDEAVASVAAAGRNNQDGGDEDDLGSFLQGVNLTSLVREFENATSEGGDRHLDGILSLAADDDPELLDAQDESNVEERVDEDSQEVEDQNGMMF